MESIIDPAIQKKIFDNLIEVSGNNSYPKSSDSLSFLLLPMHASCPYCRKKIIEFIVKNQEKIGKNLFVIISATGGKKIITSYFKELNVEIPYMPNNIFLDSLNKAGTLQLYKDKPTIYYVSKEKAYKKILLTPHSVRADLDKFLSTSIKSSAQPLTSNTPIRG